MEGNIIYKLMDKMKNKMQKRKQGYPSVSEYAFSPEEIASLNEQNKQKIQDLKQESFPQTKKTEKKEISLSKILEKGQSVKDTDSLNESVSEKKEELDSSVTIKKGAVESFPKEVEKFETKDIVSDEIASRKKEEIPDESNQTTLNTIENTSEDSNLQNSFVNLSNEHQKLVMTKWNAIDNHEIDKDIMEGKDLLNHNYTITYADSSAKYIYNIRKKYEIVLCYLIGFNNEKKGLYNKTYFSDKMENEWKYLNNYIKILEKIRNFKKK